MILRRYKTPGLSRGGVIAALNKLKNVLNTVDKLQTEMCYYVDSDTGYTWFRFSFWSL